MEKQSSKSRFYGRFVSKLKDQEIIFSYRDSTVTVVQRSIEKSPQDVLVFRAIVDQISQTFSQGKCVERGSIFSSSEDSFFYKVLMINSGRNDTGTAFIEENKITIQEYRLENPHKILSHHKKILGYTMFDFVKIKNLEKVEVAKFIMRNFKQELISHTLYSKEDGINRSWNDIPVNNNLLSAVQAETWNLRYLITRKCCWEDCEVTLTVKCSRCHHYVCSHQDHMEETFQFDESIDGDQGDTEGAEESEFQGSIGVSVLCGHCLDRQCNFECLRWF